MRDDGSVAVATLRWLPIILRGVALLLLACALGGVRIAYDSATEARVLLHHADSIRARAAAASRVEDETMLEIVNVLKEKSFNVVAAAETSGALTTTADAGPFNAVILLTDGSLKADEAEREVQRLRASVGGAPVFVVADVRQLAGRAAALESVTLLGQPVRGVPLALRCAVHGRGLRGRESLVTIADEAKVQASARVSWTSDDEWQMVTLEVVPKAAGWANYTARIEAAGTEAASTLSRSLSLYVEERRWRVLFFEGEPTWEAKFIRRALERSELFEVDYFAQVSRAAVAGATAKAAGPDEGAADAEDEAAVEDRKTAANAPAARLRAVLGSVERLNSYDCIIVGATPNEMLSATEAARLSSWTSKRGGGLVITGSNSFAGSIAAPGGKLYQLMPTAVDPRGFTSEAQQLARGTPLEADKNREGLTLLPTAAGANGALGGYLNTSQSAAVRVDVLTGQGMRLGALRPGASVLAVAGRGNTVAQSEAGTPLVAAARYGAGRTLVFAPADSWRLRTSASGEQDERDSPYSALWQGLLLWATAGARPPVEITLSDESPPAGQSVTAEIRVRDALFAPAKIEKLNARLQPLTKDDGEDSSATAQPLEVAFFPDESDMSVWRATFTTLLPGRYALEADYVAGNKSGSVQKQFAATAPHPPAPGASFDTLSRAARETGGLFLTSDERDALAQHLARATSNRETTRRHWELRTWWPLAFIIPLLLSAAWLVERIKEGVKG